jgi:hypothetical protein
MDRRLRLAVKILLSCESSFAYTQGSTGLHAEITLSTARHD